MSDSLKDDSLEVLLRFGEEYWEEIRHIEGQRATIANLVMIIASASVGLMSQRGFDASRSSLAVLVVLSGLYGIMTTAKLHERYRFLQKRLDLFYDKIDQIVPQAEFNRLRMLAHDDHVKQFPKLSRLPLYLLWLILHVVVMTIGIIFFIIGVT
ncbi:MAG TPA: hypothetical protein VN493_21255 [Thermoanaerobaculia bacterium]|nr:hypothetical protein [Thermoanaerobaculia bacterium]